MTKHFRSLWLLLLFACGIVFAQPQGSQTSLKLSPGDVLLIAVANFKDYGGEYTVVSDGTISGVGIGRLSVAGKTLLQVQTLVRQALAKTIRNPRVDVILKTERLKAVYFAGALESSGAVPWQPNLTVQSALATLKVSLDPDLVELVLYRKGETPKRASLEAILRGNVTDFAQQLEPDDFITILPVPQMRVWVMGQVNKQGEIRVPEGADLYEVLAFAGGLIPQKETSILDSELDVVVRRGTEIRHYAPQANPKAPRVPLQAGDTVIVTRPEVVRFTVAGEISEPGEKVMRKGSTLTGAIAAGKGKTSSGTLENVMLFRNGQVSIYNVAKAQVGETELESGDLLVVQRTDKIVYALGNLSKPGPVTIPDGKEYRAADVFAQTQGLNSNGTLRRVALIRPDENGKLAIRQIFNLDEFLKDGVQTSNPAVQAGDILYFGSPRGLTTSNLLQAVSAALLIESLFRAVR